MNEKTWGLGDTARYLARPFEAELCTLLASPEAEQAFLMRSWAHQHALLASIALTSDTPLLQVAAARDFLALPLKAFIRRWVTRAAGALNAFRRLGPERAQQPSEYRLLISLVEEGTRLPSGRLRFRDLSILAALPACYRAQFRLKTVDDPGDRAFLLKVTRMAQHLASMGSAASEQSFSSFLAGRITVEELHQRLRHLGLPSQFPAGPLSCGRLVQLRSQQDFKSAARRFRNCVECYCEEAAFGRVAIYVWEGAEPAMLRLSQSIPGFWELDELSGLQNRPVSPETEMAIMAALPPQMAGGADVILGG